MKGIESIIGKSGAIGAVTSLVRAVARSSSTVLILGESGTGKELVARALHDLSDRSDAHFVPVNCAAIPKELIESELFGHRKGAFTGALADRIGRFELAHGGTLFLDEIGDLALDMQVKLLRVLQERAIDPIGSSRPVPIDVRVIAATHRDIESEIASGHFRQDLFYRLNVLPIEMPPLRDRLDDIPILAEHLARRLAQAGHPPIRIADDLNHVFQCYDWPGNVRELSNLIDRLSVLYPGARLSVNAVSLSMLPRGMRPYAEQMASMSEALPPEEPLDADRLLTGPEADALQTPRWGAQDAEGFKTAAGVGLMIEGDNEVVCDGTSIPSGERSVEEILMMVDPELDDRSTRSASQRLPDDGLHLREHLAEIERNLIAQALERSAGNISQTARLLRLQRTTLIEKLNKYSLKAN